MTATQIGSGLAVRAIDPDVVQQLLVLDDAGNLPRLMVAEEGGAPLRCCLRKIRPGERVALVSYAPLRRWAADTGAVPGPYDEVGPVFLHVAQCQGPSGNGYPESLAETSRVLRAYAADGRILGGRVLPAEPGRDPAKAGAVLAEMFADPEVALVHARAVQFGCFTFEVRRA